MAFSQPTPRLSLPPPPPRRPVWRAGSHSQLGGLVGPLTIVSCSLREGQSSSIWAHFHSPLCSLSTRGLREDFGGLEEARPQGTPGQEGVQAGMRSRPWARPAHAEMTSLVLLTRAL